MGRYGALWGAMGLTCRMFCPTYSMTMGLYGALWGAMGRGGADLSDVLPHILDDHGALWSSMGLYGALWSSMGLYGALWSSMGRYGALWGAVGLTCRMFCPTYSMTISSAAMGSMANSPHSWMRLRPNLSRFLRNCGAQ